jgi:hypothetical protein
MNKPLLKPVSIEDKEKIDQALSFHSGLSCEYSFSNLFIWGKIYINKWVEFDGVVYFYSEHDNTLLMPPGQKPPPETLAKFPKLFSVNPENFSVTHADDKYIASNPELVDFFSIEEDEGFRDYIYRTEKLVSLQGSKLAKKKNLIAQFSKNYPAYHCEKISPEIFTDCFSLAKKWRETKTCEHIGIIHETSAMKEAFKNFGQIGLDGLAIFAENKIRAFSVFYRQNAETFIVHFEKSDREIKAAAQIINWETAKFLQNKCIFINREQDIGIPGLRHAKNSYQPEMMLGGKTLKLK